MTREEAMQILISTIDDHMTEIGRLYYQYKKKRNSEKMQQILKLIEEIDAILEKLQYDYNLNPEILGL